MLRTIKLHGQLAKQFGKEHKVVADSIPVIMANLSSKLINFKNTIVGGKWAVVLGDLDSGRNIEEKDISLTLSNHKTVHILPEVEGAGKGFGIVIGIALIATGVGAIAGAGTLAGMAASGTALGMAGTLGLSAIGATLLGASILYSSLMSPPKMDNALGAESADEQPSFMFNGAVNVQEQGGPVPIVYGRFRTGSVIISAGLDSEAIGYTTGDTSDPSYTDCEGRPTNNSNQHCP